jgi:hypothetical protein
MCYEERFFRERTAKRTERRDEARPAKPPATTDVPVRPVPETKTPEKIEREPEVA